MVKILAALFILSFLSLGAQAATTAVPAQALYDYQYNAYQAIESTSFVCSRADISASLLENEVWNSQQVLLNDSPTATQASVIFIYMPSPLLVTPANFGLAQAVGVVFEADGQTIRELTWVGYDPPDFDGDPSTGVTIPPGVTLHSNGSCVPSR